MVSKVDLIVIFYIYVFSRTCILYSINDNYKMYQYDIWFTRTIVFQEEFMRMEFLWLGETCLSLDIPYASGIVSPNYNLESLCPDTHFPC